jgi:hypothetical protein
MTIARIPSSALVVVGLDPTSARRAANVLYHIVHGIPFTPTPVEERILKDLANALDNDRTAAHD